MNRKLVICGIAAISILSTLPMVFARQGVAPQPSKSDLIPATSRELEEWRRDMTSASAFAASPEVAAVVKKVNSDPDWASRAAKSPDVITKAISKANPNARMSNEFTIKVEQATEGSAEQGPSCCSVTSGPKWCVWVCGKRFCIRVCKW
ncbi:hypothetical protein [Armatimonas rosea]|uniref:Uncharacterized protein n=1 Tax=Armatimonas rosea TaxID=685828 RepID=A0A7W9SKQ8_ARMRO|nr:hypothetical protein [Armatimonas rosea]MBB6048417.1 hypothetical protein [Armatimonas rosea]